MNMVAKLLNTSGYKDTNGSLAPHAMYTNHLMYESSDGYGSTNPIYNYRWQSDKHHDEQQRVHWGCLAWK